MESNLNSDREEVSENEPAPSPDFSELTDGIAERIINEYKTRARERNSPLLAEQLAEVNSENDGMNDLPEEVASVIRNLSCPVRVYELEGNYRAFVIGTNHAIDQCQEDVATLVKLIRPNVVILEMCAYRFCRCPYHRSTILQSYPERTITYARRAINELGLIPGLIFYVDVYRESETNKRVNADPDDVYMSYGGEMIRALREAEALKNDCQVIFGDRPITKTFNEQAKSMTFAAKMTLVMYVSLSFAIPKHQAYFMNQASRVIIHQSSAKDVLVTQRDIYLATSVINNAMRPNPASTNLAVAVVGRGHLPGINKFWQYVQSKLTRERR